MMMTFQAWAKKYTGYRIDYDGAYGVQCVDLVKHYIKHVLDIEPQSIGNAIEYWNKRNSSPYLSVNFNAMPYKTGFAFKQGDIIVMQGSGSAGHIAVCNGKYNNKGVYAYDENHLGKGTGMTLNFFEYKGHYKIVGILRQRGKIDMNTVKLAIDLSEHNPAVDFKLLKNNVKAVILRVGYRGYGLTGRIVADRKFKNFVEEATKNGIPVGVYFYSQAITENEAKKEAKFVIDNIKKYKVSLPVYFDVEYAESNGKFVGRLYGARLSKQKLTRIAKAFCTTITAAGYKAGVYANYDFFRNKLIAADLNEYSLWIAHYSTKTLPVVAGAKFDMWQYRSDGKVNGVVGNVDMNNMYMDVKPVKPTVKYADYVTTANVNYRTARAVSDVSRVGTLKKGTTIKVKVGSETKVNGYEWVTIKLNNKSYYMVKRYLKKK